ncbi:MAG: nicotinate (nicotinamide) nucleotide adenylyltransferase [Bacteroidia bacterium]|jgi:nicotinate-nucleotide adenylyltransferase
MKRKRVGLFFGSFNPIHNGHLILAELILEKASLNECWFVLSPHNPHKKKSSLLDQNHRLFLLQEVLKNHPNLKISTIEFKLPQPNYTINTLVHLKEQFPEIDFHLIMGMDNLENFLHWKSPEEIMEIANLLVYPRVGHQIPSWAENHSKISVIETPMIEISSTIIRERVKSGLTIHGFVPEIVAHLIDKEGFYRSSSCG